MTSLTTEFSMGSVFNIYKIGDVEYRTRVGNKMEMLIVDTGFNSTRLTIINNKNGNDQSVRNLDLIDLSLGECSDFILSLIEIEKPTKLIIDKRGYGIGVFQYISKELLNKDIELNLSTGELKYNTVLRAGYGNNSKIVINNESSIKFDFVGEGKVFVMRENK